MSNLTVFGNANLPSASSLAESLRGIKTGVSDAGGSVILKMDKTGHWVFGADQTEVEDVSTWAINPFSFVHGYIAWGEGDVLGEKMVPVSSPLPELDAAPAGAKRGWETQVGMSLKCLSGQDKDMEARYTVTSVGGKRAVQALALAIASQFEKDQTKPVPVVRFKKEHYMHKSYGRIYTPVFDIVEWMGMDGGSTEADAPPVTDAPAEAPADSRRRRRA
jgi:hypothetical protein